MPPALLRSLVWTDYRLAVLFTVILPLILLIWAFVQRADILQRLLIIYWRVASLMVITIYLLIADLPIAFITGILAKILISVGLWFWVDLNEEIEDQRSSTLKLAFNSWRWAVTLYCIVGAIATLPFSQCAFSGTLLTTPFCQVWREPALIFKDLLHSAYKPGFLGFFGILGLVIYVLYLGYFVLVRLGRQGRSAMDQ